MPLVDVVAEFLSTCPEEIQAMVGELRKMARKAMRGAYEFLYYDTVTYSHSNSPLERVCYISPKEKHVTLGFLFGAKIEDQYHLFRGIGKRARSVKVGTLEEAKNPALKELVKAAWAIPTALVTSWRPKKSKVRRKKRPVRHRRTKPDPRSRPRRRRGVKGAFTG